MKQSFKDELNKNFAEQKKYMKWLDILFMLSITLIISAIILLVTIG